MLRPEIMEYYQRGGERSRLAAGTGRLEFLRTWDVLIRVLPDPPATVWDVGGATGVYAKPLAQAGYQVRLVDPVPEHVAEAAALPGITAMLGDARALPAPDGGAHAVLLLGPLYHLLDRPDRITAWREARRVLRPGGLVVAASISRYAGLLDGFVKRYFDDDRFRPLTERVLATGRLCDQDPERRWFTDAYFHRPGEAAAEAEETGLSVERVVAVEGPLWMIDHLESILADPGGMETMLEMLRRVEEEPSLLGASSHHLTIARA